MKKPRLPRRRAWTEAAGVALWVLSVAAPPPHARAQGGHMREMMREMMRGAVPPPGMTAERLPEPEAEGARLLLRYCEQCHDLPSPRYKTAAQWPEVFQRMTARMRRMSEGMMREGMMGMRRMEAPGLAEARTLLAYLVRNAMKEARDEELQAATPADRATFRAECTPCHALPSPALHTPEEWPVVVARMLTNMQAMGKPKPAPEQLDAVLRALRAGSGVHHR